MQTIEANGLNFAYFSWGEETDPLILCLHGFPDSAHTWCDMGPQLAALGYFVVAPFLRGYEPSDIPSNQSYTPIDLGQDVVSLIAAFERDSAVVIGHDWGAMAAYVSASLKPETVSKLITLAIPHPRSLRPSIGGLWKARHFITYQFKNFARRSLSRNHFAGVDGIYRRWAPTWQFLPEETAYIRKSFQSPERLDAALGYYWSFRTSLSGPESSDNSKIVNRKTEVPALSIFGAKDGAIDSGASLDSTAQCYTNKYSYIVVPGIGHFPHRENPEAVFEAISAFLKE